MSLSIKPRKQVGKEGIRLENNLIHAIQTNWVSLLVSVVIITFLYFLAKKRVSFGNRVLLALGLGLVVGILFNTLKLDATSVKTMGTMYVNLIKMLVMPLVVFLVITSITSISKLGHLRKIGVKTISLFLITTGIAALIGLLVALHLIQDLVFSRHFLKTSKLVIFLSSRR